MAYFSYGEYSLLYISRLLITIIVLVHCTCTLYICDNVTSSSSTVCGQRLSCCYFLAFPNIPTQSVDSVCHVVISLHSRTSQHSLWTAFVMLLFPCIPEHPNTVCGQRLSCCYFLAFPNIPTQSVDSVCHVVISLHSRTSQQVLI